MRLSVVIVTCNRRSTLRCTLDRLAENPSLPHGSMEVIIVDNGSTDGTGAEATRDDLDVKLITRQRNEGVSARNHAFAIAQGQYLLLIDDDSYPLGDAVMRSMAHLDGEQRIGAVVGRITLPDGRLEASAFPSVIANGAVVLRKAAIDEVGGFPTDFFRQAEEYDLSWRIWNAGWRVERYEDLLYRHQKVSGNRDAALIHRLDMRNNLILTQRYLPRPWRLEYARDWANRYAALARHAGCGRAALAGRWAARWAGMCEVLRRKNGLSEQAVEAVFALRDQQMRVGQWAKRAGIRRVVIADFGKNIFATWRACRQADLDVLAVADDHPAFAGMSYRGMDIVDVSHAAGLEPDGVVLANINPAQVQDRLAALTQRFDCPVLALWEPRLLGGERGRPERESAGLFRSDAA